MTPADDGEAGEVISHPPRARALRRSPLPGGNGPAARAMQAVDWAATALGNPDSWPTAVRTLVAVMAGSAQPMFLAWGPAGTLIYNDAYGDILGHRHPAAMGRPFLEVWGEISDQLAPIVGAAMRGDAVQMDDIELWIDRDGTRQEAHFSFSYTPIAVGDGTIAGLFCACNDTTAQILGARALQSSEARFRAVQETSADGFMVLDAVRGDDGTITDFRWTYVNAAAARIVGRPRDWFAGKLLLTEMPGNRSEGLFDAYVQVVETGEPWQQEIAYLQDGVEAYLRIAAAKVEDGFAVSFTDLYETRRAEQRVRDAAERVALALDAGAIAGTWVWDVRRDQFTADERFADTFGLDAEQCRLGVPLDQVIAAIHPDDEARVRDAIAAVLATGGPYACEYRVCRRPDDCHWVEASGFVELGPDGQALRFPGVLVDIDHRKSLEEQRDRNANLLRVFSEAVPGVVYAKDRDGRLLVANQGTAKLIGRPPEEFIGKTDAEFLSDPDEAAAIMANDRRIMAGGVAEQLEEEIRRPDGSVSWWLSSKAPLLDDDGAVIGLIGASIDITARKAAEAALHDREERLRELNATLEQRVATATAERDRVWRNSRDLMIVIGGDGVFRSVSPSWERVLGHPPDTIVGRPYTAVVAPEHQAGAAQGLQSAANGSDLTDFELAVQHRDGSTRWISWHTALEGDFVYAYGRDVTAEKDRQAELERVQEALRQSQKLESMGQLTGGVAHDFNNLLTPIIGSLDLLQRRGTGDARMQALIDGAMQSADRAKTLVQRLLAFARRQPLQAVTVDLAALVGGMRALLESTLGPRVALTFDIAPGLPPIMTDPHQLEMALLNLTVNARDAMPDGGSLTMTAVHATLGDDNGYGLGPGRYVSLAITDTGLGMDPETRNRAIEPFYSTKGVGKGTGLGLSMAHGLMIQLGGTLLIDSTVGEGTTIRLWLPAVDAMVIDPQVVTDRVPRPRAGRVLLVEDEPLVRASTAHMLADLGYDVVEAVDATDALARLDAGLLPDLMITDHLMPGMTGTDLARIVRRRVPGAKVLLVSGYAEAGGVAADVHRLAKPFRQSDLVTALQELDLVHLPR